MYTVLSYGVCAMSVNSSRTELYHIPLRVTLPVISKSMSEF
uniref:Uncharacterized protein n=1 Tax=Rhizophora mucronata TaxID=61149 RepID=A0A2P2IKP3_RHIMU